jgi:HlyD family type I secretion membrane fusion protein
MKTASSDVRGSQPETELRPPLARPAPPSADWKGALRAGYLVCGLGLGSFLIWAALARLDGAALASGVIAVESNRRTLQHLEGGIVREILVRDGDMVAAGQVLVRLDPTKADAQGELLENQLVIYGAQEARLLAEREGATELIFPQAIMARAAEPAIGPVLQDQRTQFATRRQTLRRNIEVTEAQVAQVQKEIEQNDNDIGVSRDMLRNVERELRPLQDLLKRGLVPLTRVATLEREQLRLRNVVANGELQAVKLRERLSEAELKREQMAQEHRNEAAAQLLEVRRLLNEVRQQLIVTSDQRQRSEMRAPIAGTVQQLRIFTQGGVVRPGDPVLDLVPASDTLVIRAKVSPLDVDRVAAGMAAELRFPSFRYFGADVVRGEVRTVSRDRLLEADGQTAYFAAEVAVDRQRIPVDIAERLSAGMPAEVIIPTGARTVMDYLLAPLIERFNTSMRER